MLLLFTLFVLDILEQSQNNLTFKSLLLFSKPLKQLDIIQTLQK